MPGREESVREMLLRISGEVDPSVQQAFRAYDETVKESLKFMDVTKEKIDEMFHKFAETRRAMEGFIEVWRRYREELKKGTKAEEKEAETKKKGGEATKKSSTLLKRLAQALGMTTRAASRLGIGLGLVYIGLRKIRNAINTIRGRLTNLFRGALRAAQNFAKGVVAGFVEITRRAVEINSVIQQSELYFRAMAQSAQGAASLMRVVREEAMRTGKSFKELAAVAPRLVPFSEGDIDRFRQLIALASRISALRPDLDISVAIRTMQQFLSGYEQTLYRTFGVPTALMKEFTDVMGTTPEALDAILSKLRISEDLVEAQATSWKGLTSALIDFGERAILGVTAPAFDLLNQALGRLVTWMKENSEQIRSLSVHLGRDLAGGIESAIKEIMGPRGFSEDTIFRVAEWGANLIAGLVEGILWGINNILIPAVIQITEILAMYLRGASPPAIGILATIDKWFGPIIRAYLSGFNAADFQVLNDIGRIIKASLQTAFAMGDITGEEMNLRLLETRELTVQLVEEFRTLGSVSSSIWGAIGGLVGMDVQLIQGYLDLVKVVEAATWALAAAEEAYAAAMAKVRDIQEEIRIFEIETAEIPERYKRGRRMELEFKLLMAEEEARLRQEAVNIAREELQQAQDMLRAYMQMISALEDFAKIAADAMKALEDEEDVVDLFDFGPIEGAGDAVEELEGKFLDLYNSIKEAFGGAREQMEYLVNFMKGLVGAPAFTEEELRAGAGGFGAELPVGYAEGMRVAEAVGVIAENFYKVSEGIGAIGDKFKELIEWYQGSPEWVQNLLKKGALVLAINWVTGGLISGIMTTLAGVAATFGGKIIAGIMSLPILGITLAAGSGAAIGSGIAQALGLPGIGEFVKELEFVIRFRMGEEGSLSKALGNILDEAAAQIYRDYPWFRWIVDMLEGTQPEVDLGGDSLAFLGGILPGDEEVTPGLESFWRNITGFFAAKKEEAAKAAQEGVVYPMLDAFREMEDEAVGESIFPDMVDAIITLFTDLPTKLEMPLRRFVDTIQTWGASAADWWNYYITRMRQDLDAFTAHLYSAMSVMQSYYASAAQGMGGGGGYPSYQAGGLITSLETALLHPGEVVLNVAQQRNVVSAMATGGGITPAAGAGAGAIELSLDQSGWTVGAGVDEAYVKRMAKEGAYEGITEVFDQALRGR